MERATIVRTGYTGLDPQASAALRSVMGWQTSAAVLVAAAGTYAGWRFFKVPGAVAGLLVAMVADYFFVNEWVFEYRARAMSEGA